MAYRNGTYVAFHAGGTPDPIASDIKYYRLLKAWHENDGIEFRLIDSHEKTAAVRDSSLRETLRTRLKERLNNSRNMLLIIGNTTRFDTDWVPFEIEHAVDRCSIPIVAAYTDLTWVLVPAMLRGLWPAALANRIDNGTAHVIHIPFKQEPIAAAIEQFDHDNYPKGGGLGIYSREDQKRWGLID